jgi:hypothetical protein
MGNEDKFVLSKQASLEPPRPELLKTWGYLLVCPRWGSIGQLSTSDQAAHPPCRAQAHRGGCA